MDWIGHAYSVAMIWLWNYGERGPRERVAWCWRLRLGDESLDTLDELPSVTSIPGLFIVP